MINTDIVLKINEIYHDLEGELYDKKRYFYKKEESRWENALKRYIPEIPENKKIIDIGSGTGFVPLQILNFLSIRDMLICSDISSEMLRVCKKKILKKSVKANVKYMKLDGKSIPLRKKSLDVITMNSVLHHIPETSSFLKETERILKPGGLIIIGHEPNSLFLKNPFLIYNYRFLLNLSNPKRIVKSILKRTHLLEFFKRVFSYKSNIEDKNIFVTVNKLLMEQKIINKPLSGSDIVSIVNIHAPNQLNYSNKGFDISDVIKKYLPDFKLIYLETYDHVPLKSDNKIIKTYEKILKKIFPKSGSNFFVVLKK